MGHGPERPPTRGRSECIPLVRARGAQKQKSVAEIGCLHAELPPTPTVSQTTRADAQPDVVTDAEPVAADVALSCGCAIIVIH